MAMVSEMAVGSGEEMRRADGKCMNTGQKILLGILMLWGFSFPLRSAAQMRATPNSDIATVLFISTGGTRGEIRREQAFITELQLNAEHFRVQQSSGVTNDFKDLSLDRQLRQVNALIEKNDAGAAIWLNGNDSGRLLLQVVFIDGNRAVVRVFEQALYSGAEDELAVTVAAFLNLTQKSAAATGEDPIVSSHAGHAGTDVEDSVTADTVTDTPTETSGDNNAKPVAPKTSPWYLSLAAEQEGPLSGGQGPGLSTGVVAGIGYMPTEWFVVDMGPGFAFRPYGGGNSAVQGGWRLWLEASGRILFGAGRFRFGPLLGIHSGINHVILEDKPFPRRKFNFGHVGGRGGAALSLKLQNRLTVLFSLGISVSPATVTIRRESSEEIVFETAVWEWWLRLGICFL